MLRDPVVGNRCHVWIGDGIEGELTPWMWQATLSVDSVVATAACSVREGVGPLGGKIDVVTQKNVVRAWLTAGEYAVRHPGAGGSKVSERLLQRRGSRPGEAGPVSVRKQAVAQSAQECGTCMCHAVAPLGLSRIHEAQQAVLQSVVEPSELRGHWQWWLRACEVV